MKNMFEKAPGTETSGELSSQKKKKDAFQLPRWVVDGVIVLAVALIALSLIFGIKG